MKETSEPGCLARTLMGIGAMYMAYIIVEFIRQDGWRAGFQGCVGLLCILLIPFVVYLIGAGLWQKKQATVIESRTTRANVIAAKLRRGETVGAYICYLRPFDTTGGLWVKNATKILGSGWDLSKPDRVELETLLADLTTEWEGDMVALGRPEEHIGAGRVSVTDPEWKGLAAILLQNASAIYAVPGISEGSLWEMQYLVETGLVRRTVFIMPALSTRMPKVADSELNMAERWERLREVLARDARLHLPVYTPEGLLFVIDLQGTLIASRPIGDYYSSDILSQALTDLHAVLERRPWTPSTTSA